jgi:hypothetical protein
MWLLKKEFSMVNGTFTEEFQWLFTLMVIVIWIYLLKRVLKDMCEERNR